MDDRVDDAELYKELNAAIIAHCISRREIRNGFMTTLGNDTDMYFGVEPTMDFSPGDKEHDGRAH
ncbi:MAG: hypothetical protein K2X77_05635 [Candidatus Obscuribacterales bacterium]|nr:hypothetical protein [Candidatus Obscuribacterales bacterium]